MIVRSSISVRTIPVELANNSATVANGECSPLNAQRNTKESPKCSEVTCGRSGVVRHSSSHRPEKEGPEALRELEELGGPASRARGQEPLMHSDWSNYSQTRP
jgi:hypothetical protein